MTAHPDDNSVLLRRILRVNVAFLAVAVVAAAAVVPPLRQYLRRSAAEA